MRKHAIAMVGVTLALFGMGSALAQTTVVTPPAPQPPPVVVQPQAPPPPVVVQQAPPEPARVEVNTPAPAPQPVIVNNGPENRDVFRTSRALIGTGLTLFGVTYVSTVIAAAVTSDICDANASLGCRDAAWPIYIPVLGPFIQMGYVSGTGQNSARALLAIDGVLQGGGLAMAITGIVMHTSALVSSPRPAYSRLQLSPSNVGSGTGLVAFGHF